MQTNNKLREAVEKLLDVLYDMGVDENTLAIAVESPNCHMKSAHALSVLREARAALAEPVKNCEVGTAMEQEDRFRQHCNSRGTFCGDCPLYNNRRGECRFEWAQAPYKEGDGK